MNKSIDGILQLIGARTRRSLTGLLFGLLAGTAAAQTLTDSFSNTSNWSPRFGRPDIGWTNGSLNSANGRLEFTSPATGYAFSYRAMAYHQAPTNSDWSIQVDVHLDNTELWGNLGGSAWRNLNLMVMTSIDQTFSVATERYQSANTSNSFYASSRSNGKDEYSFTGVRDNQANATLRISYSVAQQSLTAWYDPNGSVGGFNWVNLGTLYIGKTTPSGARVSNWNLKEGDRLAIVLLADAGVSGKADTLATISGQAYYDNFSATGLLDLRTSPMVKDGVPYTFNTIAGLSSAGHVDATGGNARFNVPLGVAADASGNLYVADLFNCAIRKITPAGVVSTFVSSPAGAPGSIRPCYAQIAIDGAGNLYASDNRNHVIRRITPAGAASVYAGQEGVAGAADGTTSAARFDAPLGVALDSGGNLYVADSGNYTIRKITVAGVVTTLAGLAGNTGANDGTGSAARFDYPTGLGIDAAGNLYVADRDKHTIRKVTSSGTVTTLAGSPGRPGFDNGTGTAAGFYNPWGIAVSPGGTVYVSDGSSRVRAVTQVGQVTTLAGRDGVVGSKDGAGTAASFFDPAGLAVDASGNVYVADTRAGNIRRITPSGVVTTVAGVTGAIAPVNGLAPTARFAGPTGIAFDASGSLYVADSYFSLIRKMTPAGLVSTLAGNGEPGGSSDGAGTAASFTHPRSVAVDKAGNVFVADFYNNTIRKITPAGVVTTLAGAAKQSGFVDAAGSAARFNGPVGIAIDSKGNLYVADSENNAIRQVTPAGVVSTFAGNATGASGYADVSGTSARFNGPQAVAVDERDYVYVADSMNFVVRKISPSRQVSTLAGLAGVMAANDGQGFLARFSYPAAIAVDANGNVYVGDAYPPYTTNMTVRKISAAGMVTTIGGMAGMGGSTDSTGSAARFTAPWGMAIAADSSLYVTDAYSNSIRRGVPSLSLNSYAGTYFGTFDGNLGVWSMLVNADGKGTFLAYLSSPKTGVVSSIQVAGDGTFRTLTTSVQPLSGSIQQDGGRPMAAAASVVTVVGAIAQGGVTGVIEGVNASFSGTPDTPGGSTAGVAGFYQATAAGGTATTYTIVGSSSRVMVLTIGATLVDGSLGTIAPGGSFTVTTPTNTTISGTVTQTTGAISGTVTPSAGSATAITGEVVTTEVAPTRLVNLSLLTDLPSAGSNFTLGYVVGGTGTTGDKPLVIRAVGPSLAGFGVPNVLADPIMELYRGQTKSLSNDNWGGGAGLMAALNGVGAFAFSGVSSKDAAVATSVAGGTNSVIVSGVGNATGSVLAEVYDATPGNAFTAATPRLVNVSVMKEVGDGFTIGFVIGGRSTRTLLIRAVGPGLAQWGVGGTLSDPKLTFFAGTSKVDENDNWGGTTALSEGMTKVSAFPIPANSKDAALLATLQPGNYSVQVAGVGGTRGQVLVEVYEMP